MFGHTAGLSRESGLIDLQMVGADYPDVRRDHVPGVQDDDVPYDEFPGVDLDLHAFATDSNNGGDHADQFGRRFGAACLLDEGHTSADQNQRSQNNEIRKVGLGPFENYPEDVNDRQRYYEDVSKGAIQPLECLMAIVVSHLVLSILDTGCGHLLVEVSFRPAVQFFDDGLSICRRRMHHPFVWCRRTIYHDCVDGLLVFKKPPMLADGGSLGRRFWTPMWRPKVFNPSSPGTKIARGPFNDGNAIRGITSLKNVSLITVSGPGLKGRHGSAARIFSAVSSKGISVLLITQASSEYTITFCVKDSQSEITKNCIEDEFALEIRENLINPVEIKNGYAIITVVGDGMIKYKGIAATVFTALYSGDINIRAIAQGSSERSISTVINGKYADKAVRIIHRFFFDDFKTIDLFVFGIGNIGSRLLNQIREQKEDLETQKIKIKVMGIANSTHMLLDKNGIDLDVWQQKLKDSPTNASVEKVLDFIKEEKPLNPVFADCTKSEKLPELYSKILGRACHIATPNKIANIKSMDFYRNLRYAANRAGKGFFYETNVGAGLPVIDTVQNMRKSGDSLISFEGILSGSMSYIFGRLNEGILFSQSVKEAMDMGFTEPDPRDDLSGADAKNKVLIIAREWGYSLELDDIKVDSIYPDNFDLSGSKEDFLARLSDLDSFFYELVKKTASEDKFLAYIGEITPMGCRVGLKGLPKGHSLSGIAGGENAFVFKTRRYSPIPLVVRGYGAGGEVTAAGVFSDILKTLSWRNPISINL